MDDTPNVPAWLTGLLMLSSGLIGTFGKTMIGWLGQSRQEHRNDFKELFDRQEKTIAALQAKVDALQAKVEMLSYKLAACEEKHAAEKADREELKQEVEAVRAENIELRSAVAQLKGEC